MSGGTNINTRRAAARREFVNGVYEAVVAISKKMGEWRALRECSGRRQAAAVCGAPDDKIQARLSVKLLYSQTSPNWQMTKNNNQISSFQLTTALQSSSHRTRPIYIISVIPGGSFVA